MDKLYFNEYKIVCKKLENKLKNIFIGDNEFGFKIPQTKPDSFFITLERYNNLIGFIYVSQINQTYEISCIYIHKDFRRQGFAVSLINYLDIKYIGKKICLPMEGNGLANHFEKVGWKRQDSVYVTE